jgi:DnaJ homologue, subfamily C, member 28, conserved domain
MGRRHKTPWGWGPTALMHQKMSWIERIAERKIREAIERGDLDGLPLAGQPLALDSTPFVPEELRLAYKVLKDAGFLPPEIELRKEIVSLRALLDSVEEEDERIRIARRINDKVLRLNLLMKRSLSSEERQVYVTKLRRKLGENVAKK